MNKPLSQQRFDGRTLDLNEMFDDNYKPPLKMLPAGDEWMDEFERKHLLTDQEAQLMFTRMEASRKRFPI
jgi:hypothetical protein